MIYLYRIVRDNPKKLTYELLFKNIDSSKIETKREELISNNIVKGEDMMVSNLSNWTDLNKNKEVKNNENK